MLPTIAEKKEVVTNGRPYPFIVAGEGPLVVCLHGFPDNHESFQYQLEPFAAAGYRIVCPVMPGFAPEPRTLRAAIRRFMPSMKLSP